MKKLLYFLRWGHWPKKMRYQYGIPRSDGYGNTIITYRAPSPLWDNGVIQLEASDGSVAALSVGTVNINGGRG
jgi:hypothetical protein